MTSLTPEQIMAVVKTVWCIKNATDKPMPLSQAVNEACKQHNLEPDWHSIIWATVYA